MSIRLTALGANIANTYIKKHPYSVDVLSQFHANAVGVPWKEGFHIPLHLSCTVSALRANCRTTRCMFAPKVSMLAAAPEGTMAADVSGALARMENRQAELRGGQEAIGAILEGRGDYLRMLAERLGLILEKLYPEATEGQTLQGRLTEMVVRLGDKTSLLNHINRRTERMATTLPTEFVRAISGAVGANGNGRANGHTPS